MNSSPLFPLLIVDLVNGSDRRINSLIVPYKKSVFTIFKNKFFIFVICEIYKADAFILPLLVMAATFLKFICSINSVHLSFCFSNFAYGTASSTDFPPSCEQRHHELLFDKLL